MALYHSGDRKMLILYSFTLLQVLNFGIKLNQGTLIILSSEQHSLRIKFDQIFFSPPLLPVVSFTNTCFEA